jgi:hypothetical protein
MVRLKSVTEGPDFNSSRHAKAMRDKAFKHRD